MCGAHATVRGVVGQLTLGEHPVVLDLEAGLEHLSRGTAKQVDTLLLVVEPYFKSLETAAHAKALAEELGIPRVVAVANKVRGPHDEAAIREFCDRRGLALIGLVSYDDNVAEADRLGRSPIDHDAASPAVVEIASLEKVLRPEAHLG